MRLPKNSEDKFVVTLIGLSILAHILFFLVDKSFFINQSEPLITEWEIEAEIMPDFDNSFSPKSALPNAKPAEEPKISEKMLPQLPKKFAIDEKDTGETFAEDGDETKKDLTEKDTAKKEEKSPIKKDELEKNRLKKLDALQRLKIEKLRQEQKISKTNEAQMQNALAKLKETARSIKDIDLKNLGIGTQEKQYSQRIKRSVGRCFQLPTAYSMENAKLQTTVRITLNSKGSVLSSQIIKPSADPVYDSLAMKAIQDCAPLPIPPIKNGTYAINLIFDPKTL